MSKRGDSTITNKRQIKKLLFTIFLAVAVAFAMGEVTLRLMTRTARNGMLLVWEMPLLPYRLDADKVSEWLKGSQKSSYLVGDEQLGWSIRANFKDSIYETNSQGIRAPASRVYGAKPAKGKIRVLTLGDSFTHCDEVTNDQTWESWLERMRDDLEVINLGVPAYGTDQALLMWRYKGAALRPQIAILGIWPENICRNLGIIRYYLDPSRDLISKPRFVFSGGKLELINCPIMSSARLIEAISQPERVSFLTQEYWFRPQEAIRQPYYVSRLAQTFASVYALYQRRELRGRLYSGVDTIGIELTVAIADQFSREVTATGATPIILALPMRILLDKYPEENSLPLVIALRQQGLNVIEVGPQMVRKGLQDGIRDLIPYRGHLTGLGNRVLATELEHQLRRSIEDAREHITLTSSVYK